MKRKLIIIIVFHILLYSCGHKISGNSEEEFKSSRLKVEENLSSLEKENLEKAFRVVALSAMSKKWNNPKTYSDKSINKITLDIVNDKTYGNLIRFAEDFLKKENNTKITALEKEISELEIDRKKADSIISKLDDFQVSEIEINKGSWNTPKITTKIINVGSLTEITEFMFHLEIYSISQNKKIDGIGSGGSFEEGSKNHQDNFFAYVSRSLSYIIDRSKRLKKQLQNPQYPIKDIAQYDLEVKVKATKIALKDGTIYTRPKKGLIAYDNEIKTLQEKLAQIKKLKGTLDEYEIKEKDSKKTPVYNKEYISILSKVRQEPNKKSQRLQKVHKNLILTFPSNYEIKKEKHPGMYSLSLNDSLSFNNKDKNLIQYQIRDTTYVEFEDMDDKANGILNILKKENVTYNLKETIQNLKTTRYYNLIDADDTGYIYHRNNNYSLFRYFKINDTHYTYTMDFNTIKECIQEFDRSKGFIK